MLKHLSLQIYVSALGTVKLQQEQVLIFRQILEPHLKLTVMPLLLLHLTIIKKIIIVWNV